MRTKSYRSILSRVIWYMGVSMGIKAMLENSLLITGDRKLRGNRDHQI